MNRSLIVSATYRFMSETSVGTCRLESSLADVRPGPIFITKTLPARVPARTRDRPSRRRVERSRGRRKRGSALTATGTGDISGRSDSVEHVLAQSRK